MSEAIRKLRQGTEVLRTGGEGANLTPAECNDVLAALEAVEAYLFQPQRVGDIGPYRTVQAAFATLGLRSDAG